MAEPKHKVKEKKAKGLWHKLQNSALFILLLIILAGIDIIAFILWLSSLLSGSLETVAWEPLYISGAITLFFVVLFGSVWLRKKMAART